MDIQIGGVTFEAYINQGGGVTVMDPRHPDKAHSSSDRTEALLLLAILETLQGIKGQVE